MTRDQDDDAGTHQDDARAMPVGRREDDRWTLREPIPADDDQAPHPWPDEPARPAAAAPPPLDDDDVYTVDTRAVGSGAPAPTGGDPAHEHQSTRVMPVTRPPAGSPPRRGRGSSATPPGPPKPPRPRRRGRRVVLGVVAVLVLVLVYLVGVPWHAWSTVSRIDTTVAGDRPAEGKGWNYLLVGSDSREGLSAEQESALGTGNFAGKRTDSIILIHYPASGGKPVLLSFPRDSYVPIPGNGSNKINASYAFGGPQLLAATIEQNTNLRLDGYLEIGFVGFADVVDSLGGVNICVPFDMDDPKAHIDLKKGCQDLDGKNALGFVRARYSDPRGDIGRAERQRQFLGAVMKKAATPSTVLNPKRYWDFTHAGAAGVLVGDDTSMTDVGRVGLAMRAMSNDSALSLVVPIADPNFSTPAGSSVKWDTERAQALFTMLREDQALTEPPAGTDGKPTGG